MTLQINMVAGAAVNGGAGVGMMTSAGNPWTVADALARDLVNRSVATALNWPVPVDTFLTAAQAAGAGVLAAAAPVGIPSSGSIAANGALTLTTALPSLYSDGIWLYFPAGAVFSGSASGLYWSVMTTTTAGTIYADTLATGFVPYQSGIAPYVPGSPAPIVAAGPGSYTQTTSIDITLTCWAIAGKTLGAYSTLETNAYFSLPSNANTKRCKLFIGNAVVKQIPVSTNASLALQSRLVARGSYTAQVGFSDGTATDLGGGSANVYLSLDMTVEQTIVLTAQITNAADYVIMETATSAVKQGAGTAVSDTLVLSKTAVTVPAQFVGMQYLGAVTSAVGFNSDWARNQDQKNGTATLTYVANVAPTSGSFDYTALDAFASQNVGKKILFTLGVPADWMITRSVNGSANYGGKSNMCPTGSTELANYITGVNAVVNRLKNQWGVTGVAYELWNETGNIGFYNDTLSSLGPYAKAVNQAIKAIDPTAIILAPATQGGIYGPISSSGLTSFLNYSDGATGKAGDWCDGIAIHLYGKCSWLFKSAIDQYKIAAISAGFSTLAQKIYVTESGLLAVATGQREDFIRRIAVCASQGVKCLILYAYNWNPNPSLSNYSAEFNTARAAVSGKTIAANAVKNPDGTASLVASGVPYTTI